MEQRIADLFPDEIVRLQEYRSFVNQPERVQISSQEDMSDYDPTTLTSYFNFKVRLPRPALNVKSIQLGRASIPNAVPNLPDTECVFWYYALPTVSVGQIYEADPAVPPAQPTVGALAYTFDASGNVFTPVGVPVPDAKVFFDSGNFVIDVNNYLFNIATAKPGNVNVPCIQEGDTDYFINYTNPVLGSQDMSYLRYIRLVPSFAQPELMQDFAGGFNRTFQDYDDWISEVNNSTVDDPLDGEPSNEVLGEFKFIPNQVAFSYDSRFNKMIFTGLNTLFTYLPCASDDPNWIEAAADLAVRDEANSRFAFKGAIQIIQPFIPFRNLNQRLGFCYATYPGGFNFENMLRPIPPAIAESLGGYSNYDHIAPGYADLVYSACCHVYCDITGGSTVDSIAQKALLASIPLNTPNLGVGFHSLPLNNPLTKIVSQIYEIYIELRTDTGQPFYLPNSAIVSLEFILTY